MKMNRKHFWLFLFLFAFAFSLSFTLAQETVANISSGCCTYLHPCGVMADGIKDGNNVCRCTPLPGGACGVCPHC